jgi:hypothetical protein
MQGSNQPKFFLLNGPARSGKDTAGKHLALTFGGQLVKFAEPIKRTVTAIYHGGSRADFNSYDTAELKDIPQDIYFGKTCREVQIGVSENFLKPFHNDQSVFGKLLNRDVQRLLERGETGPFFITDSGFNREAELLVEQYGASNVFLFRIFREGHTFSGDSRGYITLKHLGVREFDVENMTGNVQAFYDVLNSIVPHCLKPVV